MDNEVSLHDSAQLSDSSIDTNPELTLFAGANKVVIDKSTNIAKIGNGGNSRVVIIKNVGVMTSDEVIDN